MGNTATQQKDLGAETATRPAVSAQSPTLPPAPPVANAGMPPRTGSRQQLPPMPGSADGASPSQALEKDADVSQGQQGGMVDAAIAARGSLASRSSTGSVNLLDVNLPGGASGTSAGTPTESTPRMSLDRAVERASRLEQIASYKALNERTLSDTKNRLSRVQSHDDLKVDFHTREVAAAALKKEMASDWLPEYHPVSIVPPDRTPDTVLERVTRISKATIFQDAPAVRKTKIVCTMGPSSWSEEGLAKLIDAGMNVARFNFSHGTHEAHQEVFDRLRKVVAEKKAVLATLLDTKGPEIRTAMLRGGKDIALEAGQLVTVVAVGDDYTSWEGYKDPATGETKIGLSYGKLCSSVKPGNIILIADGAISIEVQQVLNGKEVLGKVINSHTLGQRKNANLPGVHVDLPVLADKDVDDVKNFCCKNKMDFVAASFVQTAGDVAYIRSVLDSAGGQNVKIISKIENEAGLRHIDDIIQITDGIMVARGDLAMEVPAEKIALAQKMIIAKCLLAGKLVVTATQMLESMVNNPLPTRAEMTDVANAVFDGTDAVMLSGETANGQYPDAAVATMASIVESAELALDYSHQQDWIRVNSNSRRAGPLTPLESTYASIAQAAVLFMLDTNADGVLDASESCLLAVFSHTGVAADMVAKYRPPCPVLLISDQEHVLHQATLRFGLYGCLLTEPLTSVQQAYALVQEFAREHNIIWDGQNVLTLSGSDKLWADDMPELTVQTHPTPKRKRTVEESGAEVVQYQSPFMSHTITCIQTLRISPDLICNRQFNYRGTKLIATVGPSSWSTQMLESLFERGVSIIRINMSICKGLDHVKAIMGAWKSVVYECQHKPGSKLYTTQPALMCSIKGPEIRSSMLKDHKSIQVEAGDKVMLLATTDPLFEGFKDEHGVITLGITLPDLCNTVKPGGVILLADGTLKLRVESITNSKELMATALNAQKLGEAKLVDIPDAKIDLPFLGAQDIEYLTFCARRAGEVDFVTLPFVQSAEDVLAARKVLDENGGTRIKIVSQIDNPAAIANFDDILEESDAIMVSRGHLGIRLPTRKVCLAQKWMITKANLKAKPIIVAAQVLESMVTTPRPTRAEMTDVANAAYDGADAILLRTETASGAFVEKVVDVAAAILRDAEVGIDHFANYNFIRNFTPKPMATLETLCSSAVKAATDMSAALVCIVTNTSAPVRAITKYRPEQMVVVCTTKPHVARQCNINFGTVPMILPSAKFNLGQIRDKVVEFARKNGLALFSDSDQLGGQLIIMSGPSSNRFATEEELAEMEFVTMVVGDEMSELIELKGYLGEDTIAYRSTKVGLDLVCDPIETPRKTKIVCTLGPACWSEEGLAKIIDGGCNVARFNFSHGTHASHQEVLDRIRKVAASKHIKLAVMLDTKGPEIRTAMLRDHKPIDLEANQIVTVVAVGGEYETWQGFKDPETGLTKIGLSYPYLCQDVKEGGRILIGDGSIAIVVVTIKNDTELIGKVLNSNKLGERKNCNLPGVRVRLPVLTPSDVDDVQKFACKNHMDFIAASFVQSADDVRFIRRALDEAGGRLIRIISKIESSHGLQNFDEILQASDGIMVARGDLAMEIPSEKVALAQKMMITKANIAGKFVITATQMLESMINNPLPTRAEMTDVANAVFDGTDAVMLSGETANGKFPDRAVATMSAIVANAEVGVNYYQTYDFIRDFTAKPMSTKEAVLGCAAKDAIDIHAGIIMVVTTKGDAARWVAKYRPPVPVLVVTNNERVVRQCGPVYSLHPYMVESIPYSRDDVDFEIMLEKAAIWACEQGLLLPGKEVVVVHGCMESDAEVMPMVSIKAAPGVMMPWVSEREKTKTLSLRATAISLADVMMYVAPPRKTKIVCTLGPACWSEDGLAKIIDGGCNVARFNFSHGTHDSHQEVLDRIRKVIATKCKRVGLLLDTKGPEVRTAMVRDGKEIELEAGQEVTLVAVGDEYTSWEGYKDQATGETKIGISYAKLAQSVTVGKRILIADGTLSIEVLEILNDREVRGRCLNAKSLGPRKNVNLPGVHVDIPVLTDKDIDDLQNFCCRNMMDFVAASFVQKASDVRFIRQVLDEAGGEHVKIISKIENEAGLEHYDEILQESDGIMVARGDLAMEIPSEKVALAQKMMITKANIAGKFVITATQMLESMVNNPLPTRAEMTDVANAVFDGTDAVMLSGETANGKFPDTAVTTMAAIVANAENANGYNCTQCFIRDHSSKPFSMQEAIGATLATTSVECNAQLIVGISDDGYTSRMVSKFKPAVPQVVITSQEHVANQACVMFGQFPIVVPHLDSGVESLVHAARTAAVAAGLCSGEGIGIVLHGREEASADSVPVMRLVDLEQLSTAREVLSPTKRGGDLTSRMLSLRI